VKVELSLTILEVGGPVVGGTCRVIRDTGSPKVYSESLFWYQIRNELKKQGYDVIKKLMGKDGNLVSDSQHYVRSRNFTPGAFAIWQLDYAIREPYEEYNQDGEVTLAVVGYEKEES
jgi:hypothetical protein